jgi:hypothetical protein
VELDEGANDRRDAGAVWPWLVQIGWGRAGYYGYDLIDSGAKPSAWEILPEHQHLEIGTKFPMSPWTAMWCRDFEYPRWILLRMGPEEPPTMSGRSSTTLTQSTRIAAGS